MNNTFLNFLLKYNVYDYEIYKYYLNNSDTFDYYNEDMFRNYIGCNFIMDKDCILRQIRPFVPYIVDDITTLINIHEYIHTFESYNKLNKRFKRSIYDEVLPIFYEKLFVLDANTTTLNNYEDYLNELVILNNNEEYLLAMKISNELLRDYNYDKFDKISNKTKKLIKKYY